MNLLVLNMLKKRTKTFLNHF